MPQNARPSRMKRRATRTRSPRAPGWSPSASGLITCGPVYFDEWQSHDRVAPIRDRIWHGVCRDEPYLDGHGTRRRALAAGDDCGPIGGRANAVRKACHGTDRLSIRIGTAWRGFTFRYDGFTAPILQASSRSPIGKRCASARDQSRTAAQLPDGASAPSSSERVSGSITSPETI